MTRWLTAGEEYVTRMHDQYKHTGLIDLKKKSNEYNRAWTIHDSLIFLVGLGYLDEAKQYSEIGLELLRRSIRKRQSKINGLTVVPKSIVYQRLILEHTFNMYLTGKEDLTQLTQLFDIAFEEYKGFVLNKSYRNAKYMRYLCCILACKIGKFETAWQVISEYNKTFNLKIDKDLDYAVHDTYLMERALDYLKNKDESRLQSITSIYNLFFDNIDTVPSKTIHGKTRPVWTFIDTAYIYYKYLSMDIPFDPIIVIQSPFFGKLEKRIDRKLTHNQEEAPA